MRTRLITATPIIAVLLAAALCGAPLVAANENEPPPPLSPEESLKAIVVRPGMTVELVAAEPLIVDPVAFDWGPDGRLWVVEMRDYPNGMDGRGKPGGRVKVLTDDNHDGRYDESKVFLEGLPYPTGVFPYRDGAFVSAAPEIFFAKDTDGDGRADTRDVWFSGFKLANPQHRINGFAYGLDGWVYVASGDFSEDVVCHKMGKTINMSGRDMRFHPDSGEMQTVSGRSQFGRTRNDFDATRMGLPPARRTRSSALASNASRSTTAVGVAGCSGSAPIAASSRAHKRLRSTKWSLTGCRAS